MELRISSSRLSRAWSQWCSIVKSWTRHSTKVLTVGYHRSSLCRHWLKASSMNHASVRPSLPFSSNTRATRWWESSIKSHQWERKVCHHLIVSHQILLILYRMRSPKPVALVSDNMIKKVEDTVTARWSCAISTKRIDVHFRRPLRRTVVWGHQSLSHPAWAHSLALKAIIQADASAVLTVRMRI